MEETFLTIAEFAEQTGLSKQAIYKRLEGNLAPYIQMINGRKCLSTEALTLFKVEPKNEQPGERELDSTAFLIRQLEEKDKLIQQQQATISEQSSQLRELQQHTMSQAKDLAALLEKQTQLQENYQILLKQQQDAKRLLSPEASAFQHSEQSVQQVVDEFINIESNLESTADSEPKEARRGFFARLFNR